ncbi:MAG: hypothetical protein M1420_06460 [Actinobacteria bacterium]|nr:hypothetical protein [Actinomycetota bacterium]
MLSSELYPAAGSRRASARVSRGGSEWTGQGAAGEGDHRVVVGLGALSCWPDSDVAFGSAGAQEYRSCPLAPSPVTVISPKLRLMGRGGPPTHHGSWCQRRWSLP